MITFADVRVEEHETYTIVPMGRALDLSWFLERNGIKHSKIPYGMFLKGCKPEITSQFTAESLKKLMGAYAEVKEDNDYACIIVSNLNSDDLVRKTIEMIKSPRDKDLMEYEYKKSIRTKEDRRMMDDMAKHGFVVCERGFPT